MGARQERIQMDHVLSLKGGSRTLLDVNVLRGVVRDISIHCLWEQNEGARDAG